MGVIFTSASELYGTTSVENLFITTFMPKANGDYVKVYLYGLKNTQNPQAVPLSNAQLAKELNITEDTITEAYRYWEKQGLVDIKYYGEDYTVIFRNIARDLTDIDSQKTDINTIPSEFKDVQEFQYLVNVIETYLDGKIITSTMMQKVANWIRVYKMDYSCLYYLFDYCTRCVENNHFSPMAKFNYACKVAESWYLNGVHTLDDATAQTDNYKKHNRLVYHVLSELGLQRKPLRKERNYINKWIDTYNFTEEMIQEGVNRTSKQSFEYLDGILSDWYKKGYKEPGEIVDVKRTRAENKNRNQVSEDRIEAVQRYENSIFENLRKNLEAIE